MKSFKLYFLLLFCLFSLQHGFAQQTVQFSQYMFNGLAVNPAYAGYKEDWTLNLSSRLQWTGVDGAPKTSTFSVDGVTDPDRKNVGLGLLVMNDQLGPENNSSVFANYAYRLQLNAEDTKRLSFGLAAGLSQYRIDASKFNATDADDAVITTDNYNRILADFRLGAYYSSPAFYAGVSLLNFSPHTVSQNTVILINESKSLYLTAGGIIELTPFIDLKPSIMLKEDFKGPTNADVATYLLFSKKFWLGAAYSTGVNFYNKSNLQNGLDKSDAVTAMAQFYISDNLRLGYSYDFATSKLSGYQSGSHELSLSFSFKRKQPTIMSPRYF